MNLEKTNINGLFVLKTPVFCDNRGVFQKIINYEFFSSNNLDSDFLEFYFSCSKKDVIRGLHFQMPPKEHVKVVSVSFGSIIDVVIDLRKDSSSCGKIFSKRLDDKSGEFLYLPKGVAHGFLSLTDNTIVNYAQTTTYSKEYDAGILYNSIDFTWPVTNPIISERDLSFLAFKDFINRSPF